MNSDQVVFVVDDDISVRQSLEMLIACTGLNPECFASANDFLMRPRPSAPSCLLLDLNLPDGSGLDLQEQVAVDRSEMPINANLVQRDVDCDLNFVTGSPRRQPVRVAMSNSFGFGGSNSCVVVRHPSEVDGAGPRA